MGYTKIVKYGDITELYLYEKNYKRPRQGVDALTAYRLHEPKGTHIRIPGNSLASKRAREIRLRAKATGTYRRSHASIRRSKLNFLRMCHHNNCSAESIHFLTITFAYDLEIKQAYRLVQKFIERLSKQYKRPIRYISVPEYTKKDRIHYHLLVYDLPPEEGKKERTTRNIQRQFRHGYIDLRIAYNSSIRIAGYMAKYMAKSFKNPKLAQGRGYNCSRGINKVSVTGSNSLTEYLGDLIVVDNSTVEVSEYDVPFLGRCVKKIIK